MSSKLFPFLNCCIYIRIVRVLTTTVRTNRIYSLDNNHILQRPPLYIFTMATSRKRRLTKEEIQKTMVNSRSDLSSEDELLTAFDYVTIDSDDEDLPGERQWHYGAFTRTISQFVGGPGLQNTILLVESVPLDHLQLFFDETIMRRIVDKTNRYYL